ncbi:MAG TPA: winged helix-turn-helix transcriptional regulator [Solirubrobacterales bacterium]|nr:winged helix-turn-helix transcriptional regulator [Solirubrobacterales bacterium]
MTANTVNGSGNGARSGAQTLVLLATPLNYLILRALSEGPRQQAELRRDTGSPAQTTLRAQLKRLTEVGTISKERRNRFPGVLEYELTAAGRDLLFVIGALERWLAVAPSGPLRLGDNAAKAAIKALVESWSTKMLRALAARPLSLTDLDRIIGDLSYPALERRLAALRLSSQIEAQPSNGRGTPYAVSDWGRRGIAPIAAAARWERQHRPTLTAPVSRHDAEAVFLLATPLLRLPVETAGSCRMGVTFPSSGEHRLSGVMLEVEAGTVVSCATRLQGHPDAWALGPSAGWLNAVIEQDHSGLELGGDCRLARSLLEGLHSALFGDPVRA